MTEPHPDIVRRAASRLASDLGAELPAQAERALLRGSEITRRRSLDAGTSLAVASLLLSVVQLGWQIYRDLKGDRERKDEEGRRQTLQVLVRRMRLSLDEPTGLTPEQRDRLLEVVAEEILSGEAPPPAPVRIG